MIDLERLEKACKELDMQRRKDINIKKVYSDVDTMSILIAINEYRRNQEDIKLAQSLFKDSTNN